ncbi:angiopoietin-related protein 7-like [Mizuhopecten yessoensis]|uniref:angiopoietin-related protein 7-like n=1 Tax=Mizuhopecten yessoensis TaxID=6573 RepID=UPI000B45ED89|nr:angiopoietin-related protein 7-like [Mizuhopecten yessoensis]
MLNGSVASYNETSGVCSKHDVSTYTNSGGVYKLEEDTAGSSTGLVSCSDVTCSGIHEITPNTGSTFMVYCDVNTTGGPWTVIQNRQVDDVDFNRNWNEYKNGFGNLEGDFWLGNENIYQLTLTPCMLRVELEDWAGNKRYAEYTSFKIANEANNYRLQISGYSGDVYDAFAYHDGRDFCTIGSDNDNDALVDCAFISESGWWMDRCSFCNLNSIRTPILPSVGNNRFIEWYDYIPGGSYETLKNTKMMLRK